MWSKYPEVLNELNSIETYIRRNVRSRNKLLTDIVQELVDAGGKRLRPAFTVLSAQFGTYQQEKVISVAGALEILHTATLVHDDVVDKAETRRGRETVAAKYGMDMAIYTGDYLFTKSVLMLSKDISVEKLDVVARAIRTICEGEVDQYQQRYQVDTSVLSYLKRINRKTAIMFGAACTLGAYAADCPEKTVRKLGKFGFYYGMAFQIRDDLNDYLSDSETLGKPVANDLSRGILTLPAIQAMNRNLVLRKQIEEIMGGRKTMRAAEAMELVNLVKESGGMEESSRTLDKYVKRGLKVLDSLPANSSRSTLADLIEALRN